MLQIYDHNESVCCQKVRLALAEKGVKFRSIHIAIDEGEQYRDEFMALNPNGVVPVAVHNARVITESTIISEYINEAFEGPALMPSDPFWRARKRAWSMLLDTSIHLPHATCLSFVVALRYVFLERLDTPAKLNAHLLSVTNPQSREMQKSAFELGYAAPQFAKAVLAFDRMLADMDQQLQQSSWLAGDSQSLADLDVAPYIHRLESLQLSNMWRQYPRVDDWYKRISARDNWDKAIRQEHIDSWVELMSNTGEQAWPEVQKVLAV